MRLPNAAEAHIPPAKLKDYLLSEKHAIGKSKARFFRSVGFDETNVPQLEQVLLTIARAGHVKDIVVSPHGTKYVIDGSVKTPSGVVARIRTIWIIETGQETPRFVTAYPVE